MAADDDIEGVGGDALPEAMDLTQDEAPGDLHSLVLKGPWGIGLLKIGVRGATIGEAAAWTLLVGIAMAAGYMVDRLTVSLAVGSTTTLWLVLITSGVILVGGGWFVLKIRKR
jgi:hypothetical protein